VTLQLTQKIRHHEGVLPALDLTWGERQRSRLAVMLPDGQAAAIILDRGEVLEHGDVLCEVQGQEIIPRVVVSAAQEDLLRVSAQSPAQLTRVVYHLANRHVRAMLTADAVFIQPDSVLAELARHLGATVAPERGVFDPEKGAYHGVHAGHHHGHHHGHGELDPQDHLMGNIGESLSRAAHAKSELK
jgi:urease accessory protein